MIRLVFLLFSLLAAAPPAAAAPDARVSPRATVVLRPEPGAEAAADQLLPLVDGDREALARELGKDWDGVVQVRLAPGVAGLASIVPEHHALPPWAAGAAFPRLNLVVMRSDFPPAQLRATLRHELSHIALGRLAPGRVPTWFLEGMATLHAGDAWNRQGPSLVRAALAEGLFSFDSLADGFPAGALDAELAYAQSADFVQFLAERAGPGELEELVRRVVAGAPFEVALADVAGERLRVLENEWRRSLARWELLARFLTSPDLVWFAATGLLVYAGLLARSRRRRRLDQLEATEREEAEALLGEREAEWADGPPPPFPAEAPVESIGAGGGEAAGREAVVVHDETAENSAGSGFDDDDAEDDAPPAAAPTVRKPTLH